MEREYMKHESMKQKRYQPYAVRELKLGEGRPKICLPLVAADMEEIRQQLDQICAEPFDLVEWRADYFSGCFDREQTAEALRLIRERLGDAALLFTFRTRPEGGEREITAADYRALCLQAADSGCVDLVDVEYHMGAETVTALSAELQAHGAGVICSCHDFVRTPAKEELVQTLTQMQRTGADITKLAVMPECRGDVLALLAASVEMEEQFADRPFITMSMGRLGAVSRLIGGFDGSALTFASAGRTSAPGQMSASGVRAALELLG